MAGPTKQFDQQNALSNALALFWQKGFEATSMQDLVEHMGINRASLYATFGNKEQLYNAALQQYAENALQAASDIINAPGPAVNGLLNYFKIMGDSEQIRNQLGCFLNNTAVEMGPHSTVIANQIREQWQQLEAILKQALDKAVSNGEIRNDCDTQNLALLLNTLISGIAVQSKVKRPPKAIEQMVGTAFQLIKNVSMEQEGV